MLSKFDDYPVHQTPEPIARPATTDRNAYDRYWFNGYARDGEFYFGIGLGYYPNRGIMDCGFSIVRGGEQHSFHGSRRSGDPSDTSVGPFRIEMIEPMRRLRVTLGPNETGVECDLVFEARTACIDEGRQVLRHEGRLVMDATRFAQFGRWRGHVGYAGTTVEVEPERVFGTKDRSWGIRPVGEPEAGGAPPSTVPGIFFLWSPIHWDDHCTHFGIFEYANGERWHTDGWVVPAYAAPEEIPGIEDPGGTRMPGLEHRLVYTKGTRRAEAASIALVSREGERLDIELEPLLCFQMKGIGYTHLEWGHGRWKGDLAIGGESWKSSELDPMAIDNQHVQQVMRARTGGREGIGVLEQLCLGPHTPYGFREFLDPA